MASWSGATCFNILRARSRRHCWPPSANMVTTDTNGDSSPDKTFKNKDRAVYFRLNQSGPNGQTTFGSPVPVPSLPDLSKENATTFSFGAEAYAGVGVVGVNALINHADTFT